MDPTAKSASARADSMGSAIRLLRCALIVAVAWCVTGAASRLRAAEILVSDGNLVIVGEIERGDEEKLRNLILEQLKQKKRPKALHVYSAGGNLQAAMEIGRHVYTLQLRTVAPRLTSRAGTADARQSKSDQRECDIPGNVGQGQAGVSASSRTLTFDPRSGVGDGRCVCASACFFIWAAGMERIGDAILIHRPSFEPKEFATVSLTEARSLYNRLLPMADKYLREMGIPESLSTRALSIGSDRAEYLTTEELSRLRKSTAYEELIIARCGGIARRPTIDGLLQQRQASGSSKTEAAYGERVSRFFELVRCEYRERHSIYSEGAAAYIEKYGRE